MGIFYFKCVRKNSQMSRKESIGELQRSRLEMASRLVWCSITCSSLEDVLYILRMSILLLLNGMFYIFPLELCLICLLKSVVQFRTDFVSE